MFNWQEDKVAALLTLLEKERQAILSSDFDALSRLYAAKLNRLERLGEVSDAGKLHEIMALAQENQMLLEACAKGIRSAMQSLSRDEAPNAEFATYDKNGLKHVQTNGRSGRERRA